MNDKQDIIEFPCEFPIKIMGLAVDNIENLVRELSKPHVQAPDILSIRSTSSKAGKYTSVTLTIRARSREQLDNLYLSFNGHEKILMTL
jgi:putative lipoic acid-binding regulatory protein